MGNRLSSTFDPEGASNQPQGKQHGSVLGPAAGPAGVFAGAGNGSGLPRAGPVHELGPRALTPRSALICPDPSGQSLGLFALWLPGELHRLELATSGPGKVRLGWEGGDGALAGAPTCCTVGDPPAGCAGLGTAAGSLDRPETLPGGTQGPGTRADLGLGRGSRRGP